MRHTTAKTGTPIASLATMSGTPVASAANRNCTGMMPYAGKTATIASLAILGRAGRRATSPLPIALTKSVRAGALGSNWKRQNVRGTAVSAITRLSVAKKTAVSAGRNSFPRCCLLTMAWRKSGNSRRLARRFDVDDKCGFHLHIDARNLDVTTLKRVALAYIRMESVWQSFVPDSRRDNHYCGRIRWSASAIRV